MVLAKTIALLQNKVRLMTVSFTTNLGLAKPTADEIARLWTDEDELELDNKTALNTYFGPVANSVQSYTPELDGLTVGDSQIVGWYAELPDSLFIGGFVFQFGTSGVTFPSGFFTFSLPATIDSTFHDTSSGSAATGDIVGSATMRDHSSIANSQNGAVELYQTASCRIYTEDGAGSRWVSNTVPFTWNDSDAIAASFFFKGTS